MPRLSSALPLLQPRWLPSSFRTQMSCTQIAVTPEVTWQIHNNGFGSAPDDNPLKWFLAGRINLLVRKPRWDKEKIPGMQRSVELPPLAPPNVRRAAKNIGDRVLLSMVMDPGAGSRFDEKQATPHGRFYAGTSMNSREAL
ncbi:MAG: hypothetical protein WBV28_05325 [Terracidiphilus sp.]